jgi:arylsulfatase A-like enzyme
MHEMHEMHETQGLTARRPAEAGFAAPSPLEAPAEGRAATEPSSPSIAASTTLPLAAISSATIVIASVETLRIPLAALGAHPLVPARVFALEVAAVLWRFAPSWVAFAGLMGLGALEARASPRRIVSAGARIALAGVAVLGAYHSLRLYPPLAASAAVKLAFAGAFVAVAAMFCARSIAFAERGTRRWRLGAVGTALIGGGGAIFCLVLNHVLYPGEYFSLHLSLVQLAHLLLAVGAWPLFERSWARAPARAHRVWLVPASICFAFAALAASGFGATARSDYLAFSALGQAEALFSPYTPAREVPSGPVAPSTTPIATLRRAMHLPDLAAAFDLSQHNILLVLSEATRFDQTSLSDAKRDTTPRLQRSVDTGAFSFSRAYSPSSATFLSLSALLGMSYPSLLHLETWRKPWTGRLDGDVQTAAELLAAQGYHTFWVSHDHRRSFSNVLIGLDAGFSQRTLITGDEERDLSLDTQIADTAIAALRERSAAGGHFFGLVFFVSAHYPYLVHRDDQPHRTELERYGQEVRATDAEFGRLLDALNETGLSNDTVVVFMGDHGEEFGEHGAHRHSTVYEEALHVPLVLRIPGVTGATISDPVSTLYVLPWLLSHGTRSLQAAIEPRIADELAPMIEATEGAVIAEVLGHDRTLSVLIDPNEAFVYDFIADRHEAYRTQADPFMLRDGFARDPSLAERAVARVAAYRRVRAARRRFMLRPDVADPRDAARAR